MTSVYNYIKSTNLKWKCLFIYAPLFFSSFFFSFCLFLFCACVCACVCVCVTREREKERERERERDRQRDYVHSFILSAFPNEQNIVLLHQVQKINFYNLKIRLTWKIMEFIWRQKFSMRTQFYDYAQKSLKPGFPLTHLSTKSSLAVNSNFLTSFINHQVKTWVEIHQI